MAALDQFFEFMLEVSWALYDVNPRYCKADYRVTFFVHLLVNIIYWLDH